MSGYVRLYLIVESEHGWQWRAKKHAEEVDKASIYLLYRNCSGVMPKFVLLVPSGCQNKAASKRIEVQEFFASLTGR